MQHRPRAAEKQTPRTSGKAEEQVNLHASCFSRNAPRHELLAIVERRVIEIRPMRARALSMDSSLEYFRVLYSLTV